MTVAIVLYKKRITTTGENAGKYPIKIRYTFTINKKTDQKYYPEGAGIEYATPAEFKKIMGNPGKDIELQEKQTKVLEFYEKAKAIVKGKVFVDPEVFGSQLSSKGGFKNPIDLMLQYAGSLRETGQVGTALYYEQAAGSFGEFSPNYIFFATITPEWLMKYENWMLERGRSITTVGMYTIAMRTIFNLASSEKYKIIGKDLYPFGKGKYQIPSGKGRKIALKEDNKDKLLKYATLNIVARKGVDFWVLSYFCNGMNMADIARLRFKNMPDEWLHVERTKTKRTQRDKKTISVYLRSEVSAIIDRWGNKDKSLDNYIFPILRDGLTPKQIKERIHGFLGDVNAGLKVACEDLKIVKITFGTARHTNATISKNKGASIEYIQEALGHSNASTTKAYLDSFDMETKKKMAGLL